MLTGSRELSNESGYRNRWCGLATMSIRILDLFERLTGTISLRANSNNFKAAMVLRDRKNVANESSGKKSKKDVQIMLRITYRLYGDRD